MGVQHGRGGSFPIKGRIQGRRTDSQVDDRGHKKIGKDGINDLDGENAYSKPLAKSGWDAFSVLNISVRTGGASASGVRAPSIETKHKFYFILL